MHEKKRIWIQTNSHQPKLSWLTGWFNSINTYFVPKLLGWLDNFNLNILREGLTRWWRRRGRLRRNTINKGLENIPFWDCYCSSSSNRSCKERWGTVLSLRRTTPPQCIPMEHRNIEATAKQNIESINHRFN